MDAALEPATDGRVELPGDVGGAQDEDALGVVPHAVHLDEEFGLDAAGGFGFAFAAGTAEGVDFVDEDDGGAVFAGEGEELFDQAKYCRCLQISGFILLVYERKREIRRE